MNKISKFFYQKTLFSNTLLVIITGFIIKILGLLNRIIITRLLGLDGMSLYVLAFPTLLLFISISGMSLNITISKLVSEALQTKAFSPKILLKKSFTISFIVSFITSIIFIIIARPIAVTFLKNSDLLLPIYATLPLIFLVGISDALRGYFNGLKEMKVSCLSMLTEQLFRIFSSIVLIIIFLPKGVIIATFACLLSQSIGEIASITYTTIKIKKQGLIHYPNTANELKAILDMAIPSTLSRLIGNFTYFLEPIIYTSILLLLNYDQKFIQTNYTIINAYTIPLLTTSSFFSIAIANSIVPHISESYAIGDIKKIHHYLSKALTYSLIPGLILAIIIYNYPGEIMNLIYGTTSGSDLVKPIVFIFLIYYLHAPIISILQAIGKAKLIFITSTIFNFARLILILGLAFIPSINYLSVLYAIIICMILSVVVNLIQLVGLIHYRFNYQNIFNLLILGLLTFCLSLIFKNFAVNYLLSSCLIAIFFLLIAKILKLVSFNH